MLKIRGFVQPTQIAINKAHIYLGGLGLDAMPRSRTSSLQLAVHLWIYDEKCLNCRIFTFQIDCNLGPKYYFHGQKNGFYTHVLFTTPKFAKWRSRRDLAPLIQRLGHAYYVPCLDILLPVASYSRRVLDLKVPTIYRRDQFRKFKAWQFEK